MSRAEGEALSTSATALICSGRVAGQGCCVTGLAARLDLFGFEDEVAAFVAVHAAVAFAAVIVPFFEWALEHVALLSRGVGALYAQQFAQFNDKGLCGSQFATGRGLPALNKGLCVGGFV